MKHFFNQFIYQKEIGNGWIVVVLYLDILLDILVLNLPNGHQSVHM